jgi:hypothetical protein
VTIFSNGKQPEEEEEEEFHSPHEGETPKWPPWVSFSSLVSLTITDCMESREVTYEKHVVAVSLSHSISY